MAVCACVLLVGISAAGAEARFAGSGGGVEIAADLQTHATSTSVTCLPGIVRAGNHTTCTATVKDTDGSPVPPSGNVHFEAQAPFFPVGDFTLSSCSPVAVDGSESESSCQVDFVPRQAGGNISVFAEFEANDSFGASFNGFTLLPQVRLTETAVSCVPDAALLLSDGDEAECTAVVKDKSEHPTVPEGVVSMASDNPGSFNPSSCTLRTLGPGRASCGFQYIPAQLGTGSHRVTASYGGKNNFFLGSQGALTVRVVVERRFAGPRGTEQEPCDNVERPCPLFRAAGGAQPFSEVVLAPGRYSGAAGDLGPTGGLNVNRNVILRGDSGKPRPLIVSAADAALTINTEDVVSHLAVEGLGQRAMRIVGGVADDLIVRSDTSGIVCEQSGGIIRDSACLGSAPDGVALGAALDIATNLAPKARNVTAVATGPGSRGIDFRLRSGSQRQFAFDGIGVIARGAPIDVAARGFSTTPEVPFSGASVDVQLENSDYARTETETDQGGGTAHITEAGTSSNITAPPLFAADGFHQLPGSPTVDAGAIDLSSGTFDIDGDRRTLGRAADIGADELSSPTVMEIICPRAVVLHTLVSCAAVVRDRSPAPAPPEGTVRFSGSDRGILNRTACTLDSIATGVSICSVGYLPTKIGSGRHVLQAEYLAGGSHAPSSGRTAIEVQGIHVRYAAPGGAGSDPCTDREQPCPLFVAVSVAQQDDEVVLAPGAYSDTAGDLGSQNHISTPVGVSVHGEPGRPRPLIEVNVENLLPALSVSGSDLAHVEIVTTGRRQAFSMVQGTAEDVVARGPAREVVLCQEFLAVIRDSACLTTGPKATAVGSTVSTRFTRNQINDVTAVSTGSESFGLRYSFAGDIAVDLEAEGSGVIARGTAADVSAQGLSRAQTPGTGAHVRVELKHSDYATTETKTDAGGGTAFVTPAGEGTNITAAPLLAGDGYHQLPNSPTIDGGVTTSFSSQTDIDGQRRQIRAPDIGADEIGLDETTTLECGRISNHRVDPCTFTVEDNSNEATTPSGKVEFSSDRAGEFDQAENQCQLRAVSGQPRKASCQIGYEPAELGSHTIAATYSGDELHESAVRNAVIQVNGVGTRYAAPGGTGADPCSDRSDPCSLFAAASSQAPGTTIVEGDEVELAPGTYSRTAGDLGPIGIVQLPLGVSLHGEAGQPRPVLLLDRAEPGDLPGLAILSRDSISHLEIRSDSAPTLIEVRDGIVDDVIARSTFQGRLRNPVCRQSGGLIRDSGCFSSGTGQIALGLVLEGTFAPKTLQLRNVTAVSAGEGSFGMAYEVTSGSFVGPHLTVNGTGVIAQGTAADVAARGLSAFPTRPGSGAVVNIVLDHSAYATVATEANGGGAATIPPTGDETTNIDDPPLLAEDGIHQLSGSPTVNAGATDSLSGSVDIDGESRTIGRAADIGADEIVPLTSTEASCDPPTVVGSQPTTCEIVVTDLSPQGSPPSGEVTLESDRHGTFLGGPTTPLCLLRPVSGDESKARCQFTYVGTEAGDNVITAAYPGDRDHSSSSGATTVLIEGVRDTETLVQCESPVARRQASNCQATVIDVGTSGTKTAPSGDVLFHSDRAGSFENDPVNTCALTPVEGSPEATCNLHFTPTVAEPHQIQAIYRSDELVHSQSSRTTTIDVDRNATALAFDCDQSVIGGHGAACTATVTDTTDPTTVPTGSLSFASDDPGSGFAPQQSCTLDEQGACTVTYLAGAEGAPRTDQLTATYPGDQGFSFSQKETQIGVEAQPQGDDATALAFDCDQSVIGGHGAACTATLTDTTDPTTVPTGSLSFASDDPGSGFAPQQSCTLDEQGSCTVTYLAGAEGAPRTDQLTATYPGDQGFSFSQKETTVEVTSRPTQTTLTCTPASVIVGASTANCTVTVDDPTVVGRSTPQGRVNLSSDGAGRFSATTCDLNGTGGTSQCSFTYTPTAVGSARHRITAAYQGGGSHERSAGSTQLQVTEPSVPQPPDPPKAPPVGQPPVGQPPVGPPNTTIVRKPRKTTAAGKAAFKFTSDQPGSTFLCKLDRKRFKPCKSPLKLKGIKPGRHTFLVRAVNPQGTVDPTPAAYKWTVRKAGSGR
jgi:hypothetical protein